MATIEDLRSEVERLTRELDLQSSEINQSAKYGLGLLEEKLALQSKCEELENLYENTKHELEITQEVRKNCKNNFTISISLPHIGSSSYDQFLNIQKANNFKWDSCSISIFIRETIRRRLEIRYELNKHDIMCVHTIFAYKKDWHSRVSNDPFYIHIRYIYAVGEIKWKLSHRRTDTSLTIF